MNLSKNKIFYSVFIVFLVISVVISGKYVFELKEKYVNISENYYNIYQISSSSKKFAGNDNLLFHLVQHILNCMGETVLQYL